MVKNYAFKEVRPEDSKKAKGNNRTFKITISKDKRSNSESLYLGKNTMEALSVKNGDYIKLHYDATNKLLGIHKSEEGYRVSSNKVSVTGLTKRFELNLNKGDSVKFRYGGFIDELAFFQRDKEV